MAAKAQRHKGSSTAAPARGAPTETSNNIVPAPLAARAASGNAVGGVSSDVLESLAAAMAEAARPGGAGAADGDDALSHSARSLKDMSEKEALQVGHDPSKDTALDMYEIVVYRFVADLAILRCGIC